MSGRLNILTVRDMSLDTVVARTIANEIIRARATLRMSSVAYCSGFVLLNVMKQKGPTARANPARQT